MIIGKRISFMHSGIKLIDWLMTDGTGYVLTDFIPSGDTQFEIVYSVSNYFGDAKGIFGTSDGTSEALNADNNIKYAFNCNWNDRRIKFYNGIIIIWNISGSTPSYNTFHKVRITNIKTIDIMPTVYCDDNIVSMEYNIKGTGDFKAPSVPIALFAVNNSNLGICSYALQNTKIKRLTFYDVNMNVSANFLPCKKNKKLGFIDLTRNKFFEAVGGITSSE